MSIKKCNYCGKPFNSTGTDLCLECTGVIDDAYAKVRKYIYRSQEKANFSSILENADISAKALNYLIDSGRLEVEKSRSGTKESLSCRICGAEISAGSMCESCMRKMLSKQLGAAGKGAGPAGNQKERQTTVPLSHRKQD